MPELFTTSLLADGSLEAYYRFTSGADTTDSSSNSNTLTHVNTPTNTTGKFGEAMFYDRASSETSYAADSADVSPTGDMTINGWINLDQLPSDASDDFMLVAKWNFTSDKRSYRFSINSSDKFDLRISSAGTGQTTRASNAAEFDGDDTGVWVMVTMTVDASETLLKAYKNASEVTMAAVSGTATAIHDNNARMYLGSQDGDDTAIDFMDGGLDDFALFSRILTDEEITSLFEAGPTATADDTQGFFLS